MTTIEVYKKILSGERRLFPRSFFDGGEGALRARECMKYLVEEVLQLDEEGAREHFRYTHIANHKLESALKKAYGGKFSNVVTDLYEGRIKPWECHHTSMGFWKNKENCKDALEWLAQKKGWKSKEEILANLTAMELRENSLSGLLYAYGQDGLHKIISIALDEDIKPWELSKVRKDYWWTENHAIDAMKWLIEDKLGWNEEQVKNELCFSVIKEHGLKGMVYCRYNGSIYNAIQDAYPNKYKAKDFKRLRISREKSDLEEELSFRVEENQNLYYKNKDEINIKLKQLIMDNALKGENKCFVQEGMIKKEDRSILEGQGFKVDEYKNGYTIKW